jgi:hypothetical protein
MGLTARQVLDLARQGRLPHLRYSQRIVRFDLDDIEAWCESRKQGPRRPVDEAQGANRIVPAVEPAGPANDPALGRRESNAAQDDAQESTR